MVKISDIQEHQHGVSSEEFNTLVSDYILEGLEACIGREVEFFCPPEE